MKPFTRTEILERLQAKIRNNQPIIIGGAGIGLVAKVADRAGIDILMVTGSAPHPLRLEIQGDTDEVQFIDARELWGKGTYDTQKELGKKLYHAVIGPAGRMSLLRMPPPF